MGVFVYLSVSSGTVCCLPSMLTRKCLLDEVHLTAACVGTRLSCSWCCKGRAEVLHTGVVPHCS